MSACAGWTAGRFHLPDIRSSRERGGGANPVPSPAVIMFPRITPTTRRSPSLHFDGAADRGDREEAYWGR
jgi:hypothetical protein